MAVKMQCDVSQKEISGDADEASQVVTHKWYFSRKEIELHSPSRSDGIDYKQEEHLRKMYCSLLQELGKELKVPQVTIATAMMFCHRFYMRQSHAKNDWQTIATVCMFLACKAEETPRWLGDLVVVAYKLIYKWDPSASRRIREIYDKQKELILIGERLLLHVLAFELNIELPYKSLVSSLKRLDITHKDLVKVAWNFVNDWLCTSLCLQHKPHYIAAGSLFLAAKIMKVKLATLKGKAWWMEFDVSPKLLEDVIQQMTNLWQHSQSQSQPLAVKDEKVTKMSNCEKKKVFEKVNATSSELTNGQTSDTGSGVSVVEDGEPVTVKSDVSSSCKIVNSVGVNSQIVDVKRISKSNCAKKEGIGAVHDTYRETANRQTSDTGSGVSVVEDVEPVTFKSDLTSCKIVNSVGGKNQVDVNKIREKLKNRSFIKTMKRTRVEEGAADDGEDWIERELENGIVLQSVYPVKQRKI